MAEAYTFLDYDLRDHVAYVTFDSPSTKNTFALSQEWELFDMLRRVQEDDDVRAVVLTGSGEDFGGGSHHSDDPFDGASYYERSLKLFGAWLAVEKPIVVAFNGPGNLTFALLSDIVVAERHVEIKDPHVILGVPAATGSFMWPMSTGLAKAKRYLLTGTAITADEAERIGLISEVVDTGLSKARAAEIAVHIAGLDPNGVQKSKRALNEWMRQAWGPIFKHGLSLEFLHFPEHLFA
ncbi:MAG: enoyl-CoA hydratase [Ilumatobacteraceae bacterium]|jgi:enoyl-CoA hydratase|nr:enoyl-CoA hydratase [Ilumatobacteraceae bacterium]